MSKAKAAIYSEVKPISKAYLLQLLSDYISLTKPNILVLLLISTYCPMVLASGGAVGFETVFVALLGGALVSASASAINCILEKDTDALMERTKNRPMAAGRLSVSSSFVFAAILGFLGLFIISQFLNPLAASLSLFGHVFYVCVYTLLLKKSTPQNIVIGGAAGAVPPLVAWAAVTNEVNLTALLLFLIIFLWTPPHFWALALNKNEDYKRAGIPMLPVVAGEKATLKQMLYYTIALIPVSVVLVYSDPYLGSVSLFGLLFLGAVFLYKNVELCFAKTEEQKTKRAWDVFGFSIIYLACFFALLVVDSTLI